MAIKVGMASLGCPKNQVDGEMLLARIVAAGYELTPYEEQADVILVNTCGFIQDAKQEAIDTILELAQLKQTGKLKALLVTGCLAERYQDQLQNAMPEIDGVVGIGKNAEIVSIIEQALQGKKSGYYGPKSCLPLEGERLLINPNYYAYVKIAEGCNNRCTYCAIPAIRGAMRSRSMESIVAEAEQLAQTGVRELIVVAQDTTRYGEDLYGCCMLPQLLTRLCKIDGLQWIRILYAYPERVTDDLLTVMAQEEKIVKYLDLPIQHCSGQVLKRMNRPGDEQALTQCIQHIRNKVPNIVIRTTLMVGFPGETQEQFDRLCEFVKKMKFPRLGCFVFSEEEDTPAANMKQVVPMEVRLQRQQHIMEQQWSIATAFAMEQVGKTLMVLVEGYDEDRQQFKGRSFMDGPDIDCAVYFTAPAATVGDFVFVKITHEDGLDLIGTEVPC